MSLLGKMRRTPDTAAVPASPHAFHPTLITPLLQSFILRMNVK